MTRRRVIYGVIGIVAIYLVVCGVIGATAVGSARSAQRSLDELSSSASTAGVRNGSLERNLATATSRLQRSHGRLDTVLMKPFKAVPWAGDQLDSAIDLTDAGAKASAITRDTITQANALPVGSGSDRASSLQQLSKICQASDDRLRTIKLGPKGGLVGPLRNARAKAVTKLNQLDAGLVKGGAASSGLAKLLGEPSNYLVVAANNAEMRSGSGMWLQAGLLKTGNNKLQIQDMQSVAGLNAPDNLVKWPADLEKNWGFLGRRGDFQNLMLSPRYDLSASLAKQFWEHAGKPQVQGVVTLDISMLKALLDVTGPIDANGQTISSSNVEKALMYDQYAVNDSRAGNDDRREALAGVASAVFNKFTSTDWDPVSAAQKFGKAAQGRHIFIWSQDEQTQGMWRTAGVSGDVAAPDTLLSLVNLGTNKLDQFQKVDAKLDVTKNGGANDFAISVTVHNTAPENGPQYVLGPNDTNLKPGEYNGMVSFTLPADAKNVAFDGNLPLSLAGNDGLNVVAGTGLDIQRGGTQTFVLRFSRPAVGNVSQIDPSARIPAVNWEYKGERWTDDHSRKLTF